MKYDLILKQIYEITKVNKYSVDKDSIYVYLKNQDVVQNCGNGYTYRNIIENICEDLDY